MIRYCNTCIMPSSRPEQVFDEDGNCDACNSSGVKHKVIDWEKREAEFREILDRYRSDGSTYDCIVPVSGDPAFPLDDITWFLMEK